MKLFNISYRKDSEDDREYLLQVFAHSMDAAVKYSGIAYDKVVSVELAMNSVEKRFYA